MPWSLHTRAALRASSSSSPATKRCDMLRVRGLVLTQCAKSLLWESFRSVERSIPVYYDGSDTPLRVIVPFQELFRIDCRHTSGPCSGHRLPVTMILDVAGDEYTGNFRQAAVRRYQITIFVGLQFSFEDGRIRVVPDRHKNSVELDLLFFVRLGIPQCYRVHQSFGSV